MKQDARRIQQVNKKRSSAQTGLNAIINIPLLMAALMLIAYGALTVWTASLSIAEASFPRQLLGIALGLIAGTFTARVDYRRFENLSTMLLVIDLIVIFSPYIPGLSYRANGLTGWIKIPGIGLTYQPVELAKLITAIFMAGLAAQFHGKIESIRDYIRLCAMLAMPFFAIIAAGDLGSGLVVFVGGVVIICMSGPKKEWVLATIALIIGLVSLLLSLDSVLDGLLGHDVLLKQYQMNRLLVFLNPDADSSGAGYNLKQSLIAVGSGGFFGKGIGSASQSGHGFLPEAQTDFIFALLSETFGFMGASLLILLYALLIFSAIRIVHKSDNLFLKLVGSGIIGMWTFQIFENIGMCIGLMPITGIPLPFISFGSSSMIMQCATVGIMQSIWRHKSKPA
ncbi:FtsW/RodA/SpoVE family cell cycle protein [Collinsella sp. zg1085]|uniref:FtsW/RodA/SpoVE family cell cycle protein n=1 Tax=Collinsella sp. zg1085 TaxID=2844380 RepID=UPI001C0E2799|nr:FtsW/RodA/SpoVE family cell cycle protein [Collinsella sp. zg1085]QWT17060.1 FtsW/RodA/SpoVE family cell cycle protein [Collinsella sp. zg1085]